jgi:hypothetical protein
VLILFADRAAALFAALLLALTPEQLVSSATAAVGVRALAASPRCSPLAALRSRSVGAAGAAVAARVCDQFRPSRS